MTEDNPENPRGAVARARADIAAGREWKARDRLASHVAETYDPEALELLGDLHYRMRDLPAAGAAWFGTTRRGEDVDEATSAWRERHGDHFTHLWRSLPWPVREHEGNKRVDALRRRAMEPEGRPSERAVPADPQDRQGSQEVSSSGGGLDAATIIALGVAVLFVVCAVIGLVTALKWLVPG